MYYFYGLLATHCILRTLTITKFTTTAAMLSALIMNQPQTSNTFFILFANSIKPKSSRHLMSQSQVAGLRFCSPFSQQVNISLQAIAGASLVARLSQVAMSKPRALASLVHWSATVSKIFTSHPSPGFSRYSSCKAGVFSYHSLCSCML